MNLNNYDELARRIIGNTYRRSSVCKRLLHDFDMMGSIIEALIEADLTFKPEKGTPLRIYRKMRVNWAISKYFKEKPMLSIDQCDHNERYLKNLLKSEVGSPESEVIRNEQASSLEERVRSTLSKFKVTPIEKEYIVQYYINGLSIKEIARSKCVSHQCVSAAMQNGLKKLTTSSRQEIARLLGVS